MSINDEDQSGATQKRVRKSVERFTAVSERKLVPVEGRGVPLGEIERVKDAFSRGKVDKEAARALHILCLRGPGQGGRRMASLRSFRGFGGEDEAEVVKRVSSCERINVGVLKLICDLFNISSTGKQKKDIAESIINFLKCPFETGSNIFRTSTLRPKKKVTKLKRKEKKDKLNDDKIDLKDQSISKIKQRRKIKKGDYIDDYIELSIPDGLSVMKVDEAFLQDGRMEEIKTENISDENITSLIQGILKDADLNVTTLNKVCDDVIAKFPEANLISKRAHIKQLVTKVINGIK